MAPQRREPTPQRTTGPVSLREMEGQLEAIERGLRTLWADELLDWGDHRTECLVDAHRNVHAALAILRNHHHLNDHR